MDRSRESTKNFHIFEFINLGYVPNGAIPENDENRSKFNHIFVLIYLHVHREMNFCHKFIPRRFLLHRDV